MYMHILTVGDTLQTDLGYIGEGVRVASVCQTSFEWSISCRSL